MGESGKKSSKSTAVVHSRLVGAGARLLSERKKGPFPILKINSVSILTISGDCCWEIYEKTKFNGEKKIISPGTRNMFPEFQPISINVTECTFKDK